MMQVVERIWMVLVLLAGVLGAIATRRALRRELPSRALAYGSTLWGQFGLGLVTVAIDAFGSRFGIGALRSLPPAASTLLWTGGTLAVCVALSLGFVAMRRAAGIPRSRLARLMLPESGGDWALFTLVSVTTGTVEEFVLRGFCLGLLVSILHSPALAVAVVSVLFGLGHVAQDRLGALRAAVLGVVLAVPVLATGALLPSILAHAATNLLTPVWSKGALAAPEAGPEPR